MLVDLRRALLEGEEILDCLYPCPSAKLRSPMQARHALRFTLRLHNPEVKEARNMLLDQLYSCLRSTFAVYIICSAQQGLLR